MRTKKVNRSGGLTIPADMRRELDIDKGDALDIEVEDGKMILSKHTPRCMLCMLIEDLVKYQNNYICAKCIKKMGEMVNE